MDTKINQAIKSVLLIFGEKYFIDDVINKQKVIQDLDNYDKDLISKMLLNDIVKSNFTMSINDATIFNVNKLIELFETNDYWQNSYTKYSKKIGLTAKGKFIDEVTDVVLDFPYKDTVLKAGMTKEDLAKDDLRPDEPFLNEVIAKEEIDVLLDKKLLVNAKKYNTEGERIVSSIEDNDNLLLKGNNLIALHSLKDRYAGKVKLIYIDPPYNTGNDGFDYNDRFNHSSWLVFMKNRLEIAFELLREDGIIAIQSDNNENHYLKVLCDEIFGIDKFVTQISVEMSATQGMKVASAKNGNIVKNAEYILLYSKNGKKNVMEHILYDSRIDYDTHYSKYLTSENQVRNVRDVFMEEYPDVNFTNLSAMYKTSNEFKGFIDNNQDRIFCYDKITGFDKKDFKTGVVTKVERNGRLYHLECKENNVKQLMFLGASYGYANDFNSSYGFRKIRGDWWSGYYLDMGNVNKEGSVKLSNGKKPERLVKDLIISLTNEKDIVMDFFMGSGTTPTVALKTNRQFIGIEQLDYIERLTITRLKNVINGDQSGVSKSVNWQGGGSFIYAELMEKNTGFLKEIIEADTMQKLQAIFERMSQSPDIDFRVDLEEVRATLWERSLEEQKKMLIKILDKNQLYFNYSEIDDAHVRELVSDSDYAFNQSFYKEVNQDG